MALEVAYPLAALQSAETLMASAFEPSVAGGFSTGGFSGLPCGFTPVSVKTEPGLLADDVESYMDTTYTELSAASFHNLKHSHTDMLSEATPSTRRECGEGGLASWRFKHPENWLSCEVLDWVYYLFEVESLDGSLFRGEAYQSLTGLQLCGMRQADFLALDASYGQLIHDAFQRLVLGVCDFKKPSPPEMFKPETLGNVPDFAFIDSAPDSCSSSSSSPASSSSSSSSTSSTPSFLGTRPQPPASPSGDSKLAVILDENVLKVSMDGYLYDIDSNNTVFEQIDDSDYGSGSEGDLDRSHSTSSSEVFEYPLFSDDEESLDVDLGSLHRRIATASVSSDSGCEMGEEKPRSNAGGARHRRPPNASKGNHLWEFVRDLLKDSRFNPSLLKWEAKEEGVFKFVQSEAVAQMWGRKKNNPGMTYEKLSRAMRFCRSAGYFESVPKTGRFPKKLCFKFGHKAHGWRD